MSGQPRVTIVTPSFNQVEFIEDTILSVQAQDYPNLEHIIIDGGSTDGSLDVIRRHGRSTAFWSSEPDHGQSHAIAKGFAKATGEILAWLNSDDMLMPGAVSRAVAALESNPQSPLVYGNCVFLNRQGQFLRYFTEIEPFDESRLRNCSDYIMQPASFFRRDALAMAGGINESLRYTMDWDLWCRLSKFGRFVYIDDILAANRDYGVTKTSTGGIPRLAEIFRTWRRNRSSLWPTIVFGTTAAELLNVVHRSESYKAKIFWGIVERLFAVGAIANRSASLACRARRFRGLVPHKPYSAPDARLTVPVYRTANRLLLVIAVPFKDAVKRPQVLEVSVNGRPLGVFHFKGDPSPQSLLWPLPQDVVYSHIAVIRLHFSEHYNYLAWKKVAARLERVFLF